MPGQVAGGNELPVWVLLITTLNSSERAGELQKINYSLWQLGDHKEKAARVNKLSPQNGIGIGIGIGIVWDTLCHIG